MVPLDFQTFLRPLYIYITLATQSSNQKAFRFSTSGHVVLEKIKVPKYLARKRQMAPELARAIELRHKLLSLAGIACLPKRRDLSLMIMAENCLKL